MTNLARLWLPRGGLEERSPYATYGKALEASFPASPRALHLDRR
jgi:hypothetical protein